MSWRRVRWLIGDIWNGALHFARLFTRGPVCGCGDVAWSEAQALKRGWRWGTYYDGDAGWSCLECLKSGQEPRQW